MVYMKDSLVNVGVIDLLNKGIMLLDMFQYLKNKLFKIYQAQEKLNRF
jgi:hypothetical protein